MTDKTEQTSTFALPSDAMRSTRNSMLVNSDWAMAPDAPTDKTAWAAYRQALRDFPATWERDETADFPEAPQ
jgi:hypothetical protein